jgi:hypothetical protein
MAQSGYEIRLELLKMAKDMLEQEWHSNRDLVMQEYNYQCAIAIEAKLQLPSKPELPAMPTMVQITDKAKDLNEFINQKS